MDVRVLEEFGLSPAEIKVYLALLELGGCRAGDVIRHSGLQNSVVHLMLNKLVERGLASFVRQGKIKEYSAADPRNFLRWIDDRRHRFEDLLPHLLERQAVRERQEAEVFEGLRGFKGMAFKFIEDAQAGDEYLFFAFYTPIEQRDREVYTFYRDFTEERKKRGIKIRGIAHESRRPLFEELGFDTSTLVFVTFPTVQNVSIFRNRIILTPWQYHPVGFLITSRQVADNFRDYFNSIWYQFRQ